MARATVRGNASLDGIEEKAEANLLAGKQPNEWGKPGGRKWSDLTMGGAELSDYSVPNQGTVPQRSPRELVFKYTCHHATPRF